MSYTMLQWLLVGAMVLGPVGGLLCIVSRDAAYGAYKHQPVRSGEWMLPVRGRWVDYTLAGLLGMVALACLAVTIVAVYAFVFVP